MKSKKIGVIGGAGPLAGIYMIERMIKYAQTTYGCYRDSDFPEIILLSYPFSDMLCTQVNAKKIRAELSACMDKLKNSGAEQIIIACNTLHAFLPEPEKTKNMLTVLRDKMHELKLSNPTVLCSNTSAQYQIHKKYFNCDYPTTDLQTKIDTLIEEVLRGKNGTYLVLALEEIIGKIKNSIILLGCTELSLLTNEISIKNKTIIDSTELIACDVINRFYCSE